MVQSGEIALEQLQRAAEIRVARHDNKFSNHYDLAGYLFEKTKNRRAGAEEPVMGRVDVLFDLLQELGIDSPDGISKYVESLSVEPERRPIAEQIIDEIIAAEPKRYEVFSKIRVKREGKSPYRTVLQGPDSSDQERAIGFFMSQWIAFEKRLREIGRDRGIDDRLLISASPRMFRQLMILDDTVIGEVEHLRRLRNNLVHGVEMPNADLIMEAGQKVRDILDTLPPGTRGEPTSEES